MIYPTSRSEAFFSNQPEEVSYFSQICEIANKIIHSQSVQCFFSIVSIGVITVLVTSNPIAWAAVAVTVGIIAFAIFFIKNQESEEEMNSNIVSKRARDLRLSSEKNSYLPGIKPHIRVRDVPPDGNCFYSSFAVGVLEWIYLHRENPLFSLKVFLALVKEAYVEESLKEDVLKIIEKLELAKNAQDLEEVVSDRNTSILVRFFREITAQGLEALSSEEKQNICVDLDQVFSKKTGFSWLYSILFGTPLVDFAEIVKTVRKSENVGYEGWAFPESIAMLSRKVPLPFLIWKDLPAQSDQGSVKQRVLKGKEYEWKDLSLDDLEYQVLDASGNDYSREQASCVHFVLSGNHYQVLYGLTPQEISSRCIVLK